MKCVEGWTPWVNQDTVSGRGIKMANPNNTKTDDNEPLPTNFQIVRNIFIPDIIKLIFLLQKNLNGTSYCPQTMISAIECRTVVGHKSPKATGQNVECSLERGLMCQGVCFDYEIRVLCECGNLCKIKLIRYNFLIF